MDRWVHQLGSCVRLLVKYLSAHSPCVTIDGLDGKCVPVDSCQWILSKASVVSGIYERSECGTASDFTPLVCCPRWRNAENCGQGVTDSFPWVVSIVYRVKWKIFSQRCTGSLINSQYALTVAHCIADFSFYWKPYSVRVNRDTTYKDYAILRSIVHPSYNRFNLNKDHDVSLLKLVDKVVFDDYVQPICLTRERDQHSTLYEGQMLTIFSRGPTEAGQISSQKHPIAIPLRNASICKKIYKEIRIELSRSQLCVGGEPGRDSCRGDSGGPLMLQAIDSMTPRWYQVGLVSLGPEKCGGTIPGIYVKLLDYLEWIEATVDEVA
ncbi:AAEL008668-PA [Aedes aegypti]|uniref:CLIP domain-containing serine protease n=1 Tax=Aedes aegypti TaxID=7159 RepID=Q16Y45_AEDAE|nr:AAEL008668-PA [Aedes aegypti]